MITENPVVDEDPKFGEWLFERVGRIPTADGKSRMTLAAMSEKAAKFVTRLHSLQLSGVHVWLHELSRGGSRLRLNSEQITELRDLLNIEVGNRNDKRWRVRLKRTPERWTPDHIYRLAGRRSVLQPAPVTLEWAAAFVWLVIEQAEIPSGTLPLPCLIYAAYALQYCSKLKPLDSESDRVFAHHALDNYLTHPRKLLNEAQENELRHYLKNEPSLLMETANCVSVQIQDLFGKWEVTYA